MVEEEEITKLEAKLAELKALKREKSTAVDVESTVVGETEQDKKAPKEVPIRCQIVAYLTNEGVPNVQVEGDFPSAIFLGDYIKKYLDNVVNDNIRMRMEEQKAKTEVTQ
jgi:hypothetical protein